MRDIWRLSMETCDKEALEFRYVRVCAISGCGKEMAKNGGRGWNTILMKSTMSTAMRILFMMVGFVLGWDWEC